MESLERFRQTQRLIEEFTEQTLALLPGDLARLLYVASLRDPSSGRYGHASLAARYGDEAVQQALAFCHEQLFLRILEMPLEQLERELRRSLVSRVGDVWEIAESWQTPEPFCAVIPDGMPDYLRELFTSNLRVLLRALTSERTTSPPTA
ncbi:MAG: hypothetical protein K6U02_02870 [Firmicutes bacterium]|nr:hypothetical protein [Bacillota bacterium]